MDKNSDVFHISPFFLCALACAYFFGKKLWDYVYFIFTGPLRKMAETASQSSSPPF